MLKYKSHKGFTLIEILLATFILVLVGVAAIGVERNFMGSAGVNKHKLQATALAQEGLSAAKADYNTFLLDSTNPALTGGKTYYLNTTTDQLVECLNDCRPEGDINLNGVIFTRTIEIPATVP